MKVNSKYIIIGLILVIAFLLWINIFKNPAPETVDYTAKVQELLQTIDQQNTIIKNANDKALKLENTVTTLTAVNDSLSNLKQTVKHHYHEIYISIPTASTEQLDSIIRANW